MRFIMRSSRVSMALLTLFPFAALVSKYGILQETKNITLHHTVVIHRRKKYSITVMYLELTLSLLLHSTETLSAQWYEIRKKLMKWLPEGRAEGQTLMESTIYRGTCQHDFPKLCSWGLFFSTPFPARDAVTPELVCTEISKEKTCAHKDLQCYCRKRNAAMAFLCRQGTKDSQCGGTHHYRRWLSSIDTTTPNFLT